MWSAFLRPCARSWGLLAGAIVAGCAPALDWRDTRPEGGEVQLQFPCKPNGQSRDLGLAGARVNLALHACEAGGLTWGLAVADVADPARVGPALAELTASAAANLGAASAESLPLQVKGATPNAGAARQRLQGRLPDGSAVWMELAVFTRGTRVYQASVLGARAPAADAQPFFESLQFSP